MAAAAQQPVTAQVVGNAFVQQYYHILHHSPDLVFRFYQDTSKLGRPEDDGSMSITTTMQSINEKIISLNYGDFRAEIRSVDAQESFNGGVQVLVTGYLTGKDNMIRNFSQAFFLAPQDKGYFVLNDIFRYIENGNQQEGHYGSVNEIVAPVTPEPNPPVPPAQENHDNEHSTPLTEEVNSGGEVHNPPENGDVPIVEEEVPMAEVVNEVQDDSDMVLESNIKIEEVPKKSYASIVMDSKEIAVTFSPPAPAPQKSLQKSQEQASPPAHSVNEAPVPHSDDNENIQEAEAEGYSIYVKGLPMSAAVSLLENEFKKFGPIRAGGVQVRSNRGFCFGFVEFEVPSAVEKALEASPVTIGGRQVVVEEKRSTIRGNSRGRFQYGRSGSGFRNEGVRGHGNYGGGRGYSRADFSGRNEFNNRGGNRGGSMNRGGDGYQRVEGNNGGDGYQRVEGNNGGDGYQRVEGNNSRINRTGAAGGTANGTAKTMTPRVSATA